MRPDFGDRLQARFREFTVLLFVAAVITAIIGVAKTLSAGAGALLLGWGIAAAGFGIAFTVRALISSLYNDEDFVEVWSGLAAFMFTVFALAAFNWFGVVASVLVILAWVAGRVGRDTEERVRRREMKERRDALRSHRRTDSGPGPAAQLIEESAIDLNERSISRVEADARERNPNTRRGSIDRARMIDGNPWHLPPDLD